MDNQRWLEPVDYDWWEPSLRGSHS